MPSNAKTNPEGLDAETLRRVLAEFGFPEVLTVRPIRTGTGRSAKFRVEVGEPAAARTKGGGPDRALLLKCYRLGADDPRSQGSSADRARARAHAAALAARHAVVRALAAEGVPAAVPLADRRGGTVLILGDQLFELTPLIRGEGWTPSPERARDGGKVLRRLHDAGRGLDPGLLERLDRPFGLLAGDPDESPIEGLDASGLDTAYLHDTLRDCAARVEGLALDERTLPPAVVHGDYHPGNMRFTRSGVAGIFDFDGCRLGFPIEEASLASVHFSIDRSGKAMADRDPWPDGDLFEAFWRGYLADGHPVVLAMAEHSARLVPWIAAGAFAIEALAGLRGKAFPRETVSFAAGVSAWLLDHAEGLGEIVVQAGEPRD